MQIQQLPTSTLPRYFLRKPLRANRQRDIMIDYGYWCEILILWSQSCPLWQKSERWETFGLARGFKRERAEQIRARNKDLGWSVSMSSRVWIDVIASRERESAREKEYFLLLFFPIKHLWKKDSYSFPRKYSIFYWKCPHFIEISKKVAPFSELFLTFNRPLKEYLDIYTYTDNGRLSN